MDKPLTPLRFNPVGEGEFHRALQRRAHRYLKAQDDHRFANRRAVGKALAILMAGAGCYALSLAASSLWLFVAGYFLFAMLMMWLNIDVNHDASHLTFTRSRFWNRFISRAVTIPTGIEPVYWRVRHVSYHHLYANIDVYDLDTEENGVLRQTPFQRWHKWMRYQHLYWPLIAALSLGWIGLVFDWRDRLGQTPLKGERLLPGAAGWGAFLFSKLAHLGLMLALPMAAGQSAGVVVTIYLATQLCSSLFVVFLLLGTHWAQADFYQPPADEGHLMAHGWYHHNFTTACDWHTPYRWLEHLTGGLNYHLTHHLFPGWHHRHYPALAGIIGELAREHGMPYRCMSYQELRAGQRRFLWEMGQRDET